MFLGHIAVGLAGKRLAPQASLGAWIASVMLVDLAWPLFLLAGLEHVRIAPGITAFTPLDFYDYPLTHSLVAGVVWAALYAIGARGLRLDARTALLLAGGVVSHWVLDVVSHRADMPVFPRGPYVGLGLWHSVTATLIVELAMFVCGVWLYTRTRPKAGPVRARFWIFVAALTAIYLGAAFGPPPPDVRALAVSALALWLLVPWAHWVDW